MASWPRMDEATQSYLARIGAKGGKKTSRAKRQAVLANLAKAWKAKGQPLPKKLHQFACKAA